MEIDSGYQNFWGKPKQKPKFTEMELALMEGGHSIEDCKTETTNKMKFFKELTQHTGEGNERTK